MPPKSDREWHRLRAELPKQAREYLDANKRHDSGSWATLVSIAMYCVTARFMYDEFRYLVLESDFAGTTSLLAPGKREKQCQAAWGFAEDNWEPPEDRDGIRRKLTELSIRLAQAPWKGRSGISDRMVADAVLAVCHERGTYSPVLSCRFLAERTSLGAMTVSRSLKRLAKLGLIRYIGRTDQWNSRYRVVLRWRPPAKGHTGTSSLLRSTCTTTSLQSTDGTCADQVFSSTAPLHDAFVNRALGPTAGRIWFGMTEPLTAREAAAQFGVAEKTVRRNLELLVSVGLVSKSEGRPAVYKATEVPGERLDEIAAEYGAAGWLANQRETHSRHQQAHALTRRLRREATRSGYQRKAGR